jgi:hypothetical protein
MGKLEPSFVASYFGFELFEYRRQGDAILIASGSGLMMAIMDICPRFKWCIEVDNFRNIANRIPNLINAFDLNCDIEIIGIAGWFSIDNPQQLINAQQKIKRCKSFSYSGGYKVFENESKTLEDFINKINYGE